MQNPGSQRLGWRALACLHPEERVMNHTQGYFQTLTPTVGPVPTPTLGVAVPTHHLSYCSLNFPFTFILLEWRRGSSCLRIRGQAAQGRKEGGGCRWFLSG